MYVCESFIPISGSECGQTQSFMTILEQAASPGCSERLAGEGVWELGCVSVKSPLSLSPFSLTPTYRDASVTTLDPQTPPTGVILSLVKQE